MSPPHLISNMTNPEDNGRPLCIRFSNQVMNLKKYILSQKNNLDLFILVLSFGDLGPMLGLYNNWEFGLRLFKMEKMFTLFEELDLLLQIITDVQAETETFLLILTGARVGYLTQSHGEIKHQNNQDNIHVKKSNQTL